MRLTFSHVRRGSVRFFFFFLYLPLLVMQARAGRSFVSIGIFLFASFLNDKSLLWLIKRLHSVELSVEDFCWETFFSGFDRQTISKSGTFVTRSLAVDFATGVHLSTPAALHGLRVNASSEATLR